MRTCSPIDATRTSLPWWLSPELFSSGSSAVFPGVLVLGSVPGEHCPPGSTSHHGTRYCSQEVTATSRTARRVTTQPRCSLRWVITAAQRLHDAPAQFCGKPLRDSPGKGLPPREASTFTNGQDQQACSSLGAVGKPAATPAGPICHFVPALQEILRDGNWKRQGPTPGELELGALCHFCPYKMASWQSWASSPGVAVPVSGAPDSLRRALFVSSLLVSQGTIWSL